MSKLLSCRPIELSSLELPELCVCLLELCVARALSALSPPQIKFVSFFKYLFTLTLLDILKLINKNCVLAFGKNGIKGGDALKGQIHLSLAFASFLRRSASAITPLANRLTGNQNHHPSGTIPFPSIILHYSSPSPKEPSKISEKRNIRDHKRRLLAAKYELTRNLWKALCLKTPIFRPNCAGDPPLQLVQVAQEQLFWKGEKPVHIYTGRPRSVYELFRVSRIVFRGLASRGSFDGRQESVLVENQPLCSYLVYKKGYLGFVF